MNNTRRGFLGKLIGGVGAALLLSTGRGETAQAEHTDRRESYSSPQAKDPIILNIREPYCADFRVTAQQVRSLYKLTYRT